MNLANLVQKISAGVGIYNRLTDPIGVDEIALKTAISANDWARAAIGEEPFPDVGQDDRVLSDTFEITGSGYVWFQRQFRLLHSASGIESRWINGREKPQEVVRIN